MAIDFPAVSGLANGATITRGDVVYTLHKTSNTVYYWSGSLAENPDGRYVNITGDNMTGSLGGVSTLGADNLTDGITTKTMTEVLSTGASGSIEILTLFNANGSTLLAKGCTVTRTSAGRYTINFSTAQPNTNYAVFGTITGTAGGNGDAIFRVETRSTTNCEVMTAVTAGGARDFDGPTSIMIVR